VADRASWNPAEEMSPSAGSGLDKVLTLRRNLIKSHYSALMCAPPNDVSTHPHTSPPPLPADKRIATELMGDFSSSVTSPQVADGEKLFTLSREIYFVARTVSRFNETNTDPAVITVNKARERAKQKKNPTTSLIV
jgi:hypothetical protein